MIKYTIKRLLMVIPVILGVLLIVFLFQAVSDDDPALAILGAGSTEEARAEMREELGLNDPIPVQYVRYVWNFATKGDLGTSYKSNQPVFHELMLRFPTTVKLSLIAVVLGVLIGIPLGIWSAVKQYTAIDSTIVTFSVAIESMPSFWLALLLISLFSVKLNWLPTSGLTGLKSWILPSVVVATASTSMIIRVTRSSMLETIRQDYIRMARAKGQSELNITIHHVLRNSMIPILSAIGNTIGMQLGGALIVESIFGMPGIGKYALDAIGARNYPAVMGSVVVLAITFTLVNLLVDLTYAFVDPKLRTSLIGGGSKRKKKHQKAPATGGVSHG